MRVFIQSMRYMILIVSSALIVGSLALSTSSWAKIVNVGSLSIDDSGFTSFTILADTDGFTSADLLTWKKKSQDSFFQTSIGMAGVIASQNRREAAKCIDDWYFATNATQQRRNDHIRKVMADNPSFHPQATILAILRKECEYP